MKGAQFCNGSYIFFFAKSGTQKVKGFGPCGGASLYKALLNTSLPPRLFVCLCYNRQQC